MFMSHGGKNHVLSKLRKRYWTTNADSVARKVIGKCYVRRLLRRKVGEQKMADLPGERTQEYLPLLQERQKWNREIRNFLPGDVVVVDSMSPRGSWILGKILETVHDKKGLVCSVCLQTKTSVLERPVRKISFLCEANE